MEEELSMLKKSLISLVVSSPTTMTVSRLLKDYRSLVGGVLPLAKFGYREPVLFLKERCTDIFVIEGPSWDPILTPKVTKNLAHIDKMVQKQKVQSTVKHKGKRRSIMQPNPPVEGKPIIKFNPNNRYDQQNGYDPPNRYEPPNRYDPPNSFNPQIKYEQQNRHIPSNGFHYSTNNKYKQPVGRQHEIPAKPQNQTYPKTAQDFNKEYDDDTKNIGNKEDCNTNQYVSSKSTTHDNKNESVSVTSVEDSPSSALSKFYKKRLPQYISDTDFPSPDSEQTSKSSAESGRLSSTSSGSKQMLLEELKEEIMALIHNSPGGVWCTDLIRLYKERYGRELKFSRFGHTRLISLIYSMEEQVAISRPTPDSDWLLKHRDSVGAEGVAGAGAGVPRRAPRPPPPPVPSTPTDEDALPGVEFEEDVFPPDCLHYLDSIPGGALQGAAPGRTLEVLLGEVYSPSHFWMLRVGPQHNMAMEQIMDEMNEYYAGAGAPRVLSRGALRVGQYCAALFDGDWHRAVIVCLIDSDTVKVRHVDYGTVDTLAARSLKPLRRGWGALPAQAVRARLAGVRPAAAGWRWPRAACAWFLQRVQQRRLYAHLHALDPQEDIVETFLIDTSGAEDACLTRELIRVGHADARAHSALQSEDCYLYPRFEALETGATPNYGDICRMLADGIALEYVDEYRRHVPGPWARPAAPAPPSPPPPAPAPPAQDPLEVRLSAAEWAVLSRLRGADPAAAHWYLLTSACRAMMPPPPGL